MSTATDRQPTVRIHTRGEHPPPHFHAHYQGEEALVEIETGDCFAGSLPRRAASLAEEWRQQHVAELRRNWQLAQHLQPHEPIDPLE